jgi:hypothetical protein
MASQAPHPHSLPLSPREGHSLRPFLPLSPNPVPSTTQAVHLKHPKPERGSVQPAQPERKQALRSSHAHPNPTLGLMALRQWAGNCAVIPKPEQITKETPSPPRASTLPPSDKKAAAAVKPGIARKGLGTLGWPRPP